MDNFEHGDTSSNCCYAMGNRLFSSLLYFIKIFIEKTRYISIWEHNIHYATTGAGVPSAGDCSIVVCANSDLDPELPKFEPLLMRHLPPKLDDDLANLLLIPVQLDLLAGASLLANNYLWTNSVRISCLCVKSVKTRHDPATSYNCNFGYPHNIQKLKNH